MYRENQLCQSIERSSYKLLNNIEIGIGGHLDGLRGRIEGKTFDGDLPSQLGHLSELISAYDTKAQIQFLETRPPMERAEEFGEITASFGMPVKQFTDLYVIGGNDNYPDGLESLRVNLELAKRAGTIDRLNMQVWGNNETPDIEALVKFYIAAEELAQDYGIELYTETHIDRFTYDPRRLIAVHEALLDRTGGRLGIRVSADLSHYVHQLRNTHFPNWEDISSGALNLNPLDSENYVSRNLISTGLIGYGHLRAAVPNNIPRGHGSIQYPVVNPKNDPATAALENGGMLEPWEPERLVPWTAWYREIFRFQLQQKDRAVARFSSEYIGDATVGDSLGEYRMGAYNNLYQNVAMVSIAQKMAREIIADLNN